MKLANNDKFETYFESKKYFENQLRVTPDELQIVAKGPRSKFSSGGAKEECVKENVFWGGPGGACLWISIQFL